MGFLDFLLPSDSRFYGLFEEISANLRRASAAIAQHSSKAPAIDWAEAAREIKALEHANDIHTHKVMSELHNAFITPFDREDIHQLASSLDDILDYATYSFQRGVAYEMGMLTAPMTRQLGCLTESIVAVCEIVERLRDLKNISQISPYLMEVHRLENEGDQAYMDALARLFKDGHDPLTVIKWKDIHHLVETAIDRCERAADVAEGIAIKHA